MQLSFAPLPLRATRFSFKQGLSGTLTGLTTAGAFTVVAFNLSNADKSIGSAFDPIKKLLEKSALLNGINQLGTTFYSWGSKIVGAKDDFKEWVSSYLNPSGLKAGAVAVYNKLHDWSLIVYRWFRDKFWTFITNIPDMVKNWDKLRLSLFKWGTFLGGGGGAALFAMFGSGENWGKLQELMGRGDFEEIMKDLGALMENNNEAFEKMGSEKVQEILQKFLDDTEEAKAATKELLERQEKRQKEKKDEEKESEQLSQEEILEEFNSSGGGNPPDTKAVFGNMVSGGLGKLFDLLSDKAKPSSIDGKNAYWAAYEGMKEYVSKIEKGIERERANKKENTIKQKFKNAIDKNRFAFMNGLASVAERAYKILEKEKPTPPSGESKITKERLAEVFMEEFKKSFTTEVKGDQKGDFDLDQKLFVPK